VSAGLACLHAGRGRGDVRAARGGSLATFAALAAFGAFAALTTVGALGVSACQPVEAAPEAKAKPIPPPADLMASVALGPTGSLRGLQAYVDAIKPGAGAMISDQVVRDGLAKAAGMHSLDGFDPSGWTYVLVADGADTVALLGKVADAAKLATSADTAHVMVKGSWAAVGPKALLERFGPYAFAALATQPAPPAPTVTVYLTQVMARHQREVQGAIAKMQSSMATFGGTMAQLMTAYIDGFSSLAADTDTLTIRLEADADAASLDLSLTPRPKSRLAAFAALQHPTDYALLDKLPAASAAPTMLIGGHLELGPYHDGIMSAMTAMYGPEASTDLLAAMDTFRKTLTGDFVMTAQIARGTGITMTQLYGTTNAGAANKSVAAMLELFKTGRTLTAMNLSTTITASPETASHDGVTLRGYDTLADYSKATPAQQQAMDAMMASGVHRTQIGAFDAVTMVVVAKDSLAEAKRTIDAARGKAAHFTPAGASGGLLAWSHTRKDSLAMVMDLGAFLGAMTGKPMADLPILLALGFADHNAHIRFAVPAATAQTLMKSANP